MEEKQTENRISNQENVNRESAYSVVVCLLLLLVFCFVFLICFVFCCCFILLV